MAGVFFCALRKQLLITFMVFITAFIFTEKNEELNNK